MKGLTLNKKQAVNSCSKSFIDTWFTRATKKETFASFGSSASLGKSMVWLSYTVHVFAAIKECPEKLTFDF